ncbi:thioredoxin-disulfide reductase [candidate division WOR-3 bacterium JGI_Cruoil_03_51_56]|uniref:Thioredoxin reductase n=1 Tax=candidate division WOR-3 bacterium JGI_Cruoil_03_51_56 TaxID=1973747 RepID=A0A235BTK5_UNCW3|nr:MAG: thioredoxin-disulfide reductase [candidate division WOR-3 bacterium JGI_Cruoil_03_51_56]
MEIPEILIIGAGPAGLTAGIYAARSGYNVAIVGKGIPGGQVTQVREVENYPGFAEPVNAFKLAKAIEQQTRGFGCAIESGEATGLTCTDNIIEVQTTLGILKPEALIIATGVEPRQLCVPGEQELRGRGVSYCAVCDGPLFKNKEVAVIGGGDSALDESLYLSGICSEVYLIHRRDQFRGTRIAEKRVRSKKNIHLILSSIVTAIKGKETVKAIEITKRKDNTRTILPVSGVFLYVGSVPSTQWCRSAVELDGHGFVKTDDRLRTNVSGVFAAGDVRKTYLRQIVTAVGDGALAAMMAHDYLAEKH